MLIDRTIDGPGDREVRLPVGKTFAGVGEFNFAIDLAIYGSKMARESYKIDLRSTRCRPWMTTVEVERMISEK
jgi:hypothetical protein